MDWWNQLRPLGESLKSERLDIRIEWLTVSKVLRRSKKRANTSSLRSSLLQGPSKLVHSLKRTCCQCSLCGAGLHRSAWSALATRVRPWFHVNISGHWIFWEVLTCAQWKANSWGNYWLLGMLFYASGCGLKSLPKLLTGFLVTD